MKRFDTGDICLLPDKIQQLRDTGQLGVMIVPPHQRDTQLLTVFDPINNINTEAIKIDRWEPVREGSYLCKPIGLEMQMIDPIPTPPELWGYLNTMLLGNPIKNCAAVNWLVHAHPWQDLQDIKHCEDARARTLERAIEHISWELDDPQFRSDRAFCENLHLMDDATKLNYIGGGVKTFSVRAPWLG